MPPRPPVHVYGVLAVAVLAISSSAVLVKGMEGIEPVAIAWWRMTGATLLLLPAVRAVSRADGLKIALAGAFLAAHFTAWFASLQHTTVLRSTVLVCTGPVWVGGIAALRGQHPPRRFWVGIGVGVLGVGVLSSAPSVGGSAYGDGLAVLGAWCVAGYLTLGQDVRQRVGIGTYSALVCGAAALALLPVSLLSATPVVGFSGATWLLLLGAILGPQLVGHNGLNYALGFVPTTTVAAATLLEPVGAALLAMLLLGEIPPTAALVGGVLVLGGVGTATREEA